LKKVGEEHCDPGEKRKSAIKFNSRKIIIIVRKEKQRANVHKEGQPGLEEN